MLKYLIPERCAMADKVIKMKNKSLGFSFRRKKKVPAEPQVGSYI